MSVSRPPRNDGVTDISYVIVPDDPELNRYLSELLNEAWHVHQHHRDGNWKKAGGYKDKYAARIALKIRVDKSLLQKLLNVRDRVLSMLTYRAIELLKENSDIDTLAGLRPK